MKENPIQKRILLHCGHGLTRLFRINVAKAWIGDWRRLRNGDILIKNPRRLHAGFKGMSDLIGWHTVIITPEMVGRKLAVFSALEVKSKSGRATDDQLNFIENVRAAGGLAGIVRSPEEAEDLLNEIE